MDNSHSPLHAPLGLQLSEEAQPVPVDIEVSAAEREMYSLASLLPSGYIHESAAEDVVAKSAIEDTVLRPTRPKFKVSDEIARIRLSRSAASVLEPVSHVIETISRVRTVDDLELLRHTPSLLDYFPDQLRPRMDSDRKTAVRDDGLADLGSDAVYRLKKVENVEAISVDTVTPPPEPAAVDEGPAAPTQTAPPVTTSTVVKTTAEGVSVAHSPAAYDLSGSMPWAYYTVDGFSPLHPSDIRYHRVHLCSPNTDKAQSAWSVFGPKPVGDLEIPPDGACPFKNSQQLSLRDTCDFVLMESVEQLPLLMHFHGMSGALLRYWRQRHTGLYPDADQVEAMGPLGQLVKLETDFVPRLFGGNVIKLETACTIFESSLIRAPVFRHSSAPTDFLLVRARKDAKSQQALCVLRELKHVYCMGQAEPLYRIDVPVAPRLHQSLAARVMVECRRFWLKAKQHPTMDFMNRMFAGERKSLLTRYLADAIRDLQQRPSQPVTATTTPEEQCVVNGLKEGLRRLAERGIERIFAISPMRIRNYVRDIEVFERSMPLSSRTPRVAHFCVQLENEMRISPWNLTNDYWDVMTGKRAAMFQFTPLGDPSGGRGEGISYRKILRSETSSSAAVLNSVTGANAAPVLEIDEIRSKSKKQLVTELQKLNVPDRVWKSMSRWQLMRQLSLLLGIEDDAEERLVPWKRKALHAERILEAWKKQSKALADPHPPPVSVDDIAKGSEAYARFGVDGRVLSSSATPNETPDDSSDSDNDPSSTKKEEDDMHAMLLKELEQAGEDQAVSMKPKITRLEIVSTGRTKSTGNAWSQVTYVYGAKNIALYRKWKELEEDGPPAAPADVAAPGAGQVPANLAAKVEMTLKVHRRFQRMIKQAAEAGRAIPDCKRCGACHLFGHDQTFEGCPVLVRDMELNATSTSATRKRKNIEQSPVYD